MKLKLISDLPKKELAAKTVFLRLDLNVLIKAGKVQEDFRLRQSLPMINYLLARKCKIIIGSHLGRPPGRQIKALSLAPVAKRLKELLPKVKIKFIDKNIEDKKVVNKIDFSRVDIIFLENLRFYYCEQSSDCFFTKVLAGLAEIYINEAFGVCHRKTASTVGITKYLPSYAGLNLAKEVDFLQKALYPKKPAIAIIGGVKIESKFGTIKNLLNKYNKILVGGGIANLFLQAAGYEIGASIIDRNYLKKAKQLISDKIVLPIDFVIADKKTKTKIRYHKLKWGKQICRADEMILDIGPKTVVKFFNTLKHAKTIVWAGPVGMVDEPDFAKGTINLAKSIAKLTSRHCLTIAGGGETIFALNLAKAIDKYSFVSTGGGAMLEFLEGKNLPGLEALKIKAKIKF